MWEVYVGVSMALVLWFFTTLGLNLNEQHSAIKGLLLMTSFFLLPLFVNIAVKMAEANSATANIISNLNVVYKVVVWIDYFMMFYFAGYIILIVYKLIVKNTKGSLRT